MLHRIRLKGLILIAAGLQLSACGGAGPGKVEKVKPATVEHIEGQEISRITLTPRAAERLDIKTATVREPQVTRSGSRSPVVPYAAVLYDAKGATWVYTSPTNLVYVRHRVTVDYIDGYQAVLTDGPPAGTQVVTVGGQELFGAEFEIGH